MAAAYSRLLRRRASGLAPSAQKLSTSNCDPQRLIPGSHFFHLHDRNCRDVSGSGFPWIIKRGFFSALCPNAHRREDCTVSPYLLQSQRSLSYHPTLGNVLDASSDPWSKVGFSHHQKAPFSQQSHHRLDESPDCPPLRPPIEQKRLESLGRVAERSWVDRFLPHRLRPFALLARVDKPIGTWLLAWPCMWSIALAAPGGSFPDFKMLFLFGIGAVLLRGAGCTVNDLLDQDIDCKVERTKLRPIASGAVTSFQGLTFLGMQLLLGLGILLQLNQFSQILGASSLLLVGTYPLLKRWTYWPQAYLGLTFNWGALLGWAAVRGSIDPYVVMPLYLSGICWTLVYDTIYAHQDKEDDEKVGVKSTALYFGDQTKLWLGSFGTATISSLCVAGFNADVGWTFYTGLLAAAGHLFWQISTVDLHSRADCNSKFVSNKWFGALVFAGIASGKLAGY